jgi:hypothetical protein
MEAASGEQGGICPLGGYTAVHDPGVDAGGRMAAVRAAPGEADKGAIIREKIADLKRHQ